MPARIDPALRTRLVEELVRRLGDENPTTIRSLATAVGTSTMTIYTQFGGMPGLWSAAREEGFRRLAAALAEVRERRRPGRAGDGAGLGVRGPTPSPTRACT